MEVWVGGLGSTAPLFGAGRAELCPEAGALPFFHLTRFNHTPITHPSELPLDVLCDYSMISLGY
jgi:hypothetical protein